MAYVHHVGNNIYYTVGESLVRAGAEFVSTYGQQIAAMLTSSYIYSKFSIYLLKKDAKEIGKAIGEMSKTALKGFSEGVSGMVNEVGTEFAKTVAEGNSTIATSVRSSWGPTLLVMGVIGTAIPLAYHYVYEVMKQKIGKPALLMNAKVTHWYTPLTSRIAHLFQQKQEEAAQPIFHPELQRQIADITKAANNIAKNKGFFENVLLYGLPGTGKTMVAEKIARDSGLDYYMMSAAELPQFIDRGEHVSEMNKLITKVETSGKPAVLFLDECDAITNDRNKLDQAHRELLTTLLKRIGVQSKRILVIAATNRMDDLDPAFMSRMTYKIHVDVPALEERKQILEQYIRQFFTPEEIKQFFSPSAILTIAQQVEGFSGRSIFQMINSLFNKKFTTETGTLSQSLIEQHIALFVKEERECQK